MTTTLEKAKLTPVPQGSAPEIVFMFNPTELKFSRTLNIEQAAGATTQRGQNKPSFKHPNPYQLTISNIILDTYEDPYKKTQEISVLEKLKPFRQAVTFVQGGGQSQGQSQGARRRGAGQSQQQSRPEQRPPIYLFTWGNFSYMRCFVKTFNFRLTMFLPDGVPVRAIVDLTLEQAEDPRPRPGLGTPAVSPADRDANALFLD